MEDRIGYKELMKRIVTAEAAAQLLKDGMTVAFGGYTSSGYPKAVALALVERKRQGESLQIRMLSGANDGPLDTLLGEAGLISWRAPMIESKVLAKEVNCGHVQYVEQQMNKMPRLVSTEAFGKIDVAIVEALRITKEGYVVPTSSVGMIPWFLEKAEIVIVEINTAQPLALEGMHDIYLPDGFSGGEPIPLRGINEKIGTPYIKVDPKKIRYIVPSAILDETKDENKVSLQSLQIAKNLVTFLEEELQRMPQQKLPPFQTGFGHLATEIVRELGESSLPPFSFFCGGLQEANIALIARGRVVSASTGSIQMTPRVIELMETHKELFQKCVVIRNTDITNNSETIGRFRPITLTSGIEMDIYGNVNSSHVSASQVVNGLGGGANFAQNAGLSIMLLPSESKGGAISTIVPMVSHQDISEHDIDVVITENGVADLRGKDEITRAKLIIACCAATRYRDALRDYLERAIQENGGHHPHLLEEAFSWHIRLKETGSMEKTKD